MTDAYKVGVSVALNSVMGAEILKIAEQFGIADKAAAGFAKNVALVAGSLVVMGAALGVGVNEAIKFETELAKFRLYGMGDKLNNDAKNFAMNMKIAGVNYTEGMHLMNEAQGVFRQSGHTDGSNLDAAKIALPTMEKLDYLDKVYGTDKHAESLAMLRWIDMEGGNTSAKRFNDLADLGFRLKNTSGGQVDFEQLRQFRARSKAAGFTIDDDAYAMLEPIIGELKGMTAGVSLSTAYNRAHGLIKPPNQAVGALIEYGAWDKSQLEMNALGGIKKMKDDPLIDAELYNHNFIEWYFKHIKPAYDKAGLTFDQRVRENTMMFGGTGGNMMSLVERQAEVIKASHQSVTAAMGINAAYDDAKTTPKGKIVELTAEFEKLMTRLGEDVMPGVNKSLSAFLWVLEKVEGLFAAQDAAHEAHKDFSLLNWLGGGTGHAAGAPPTATNQQPIVVQSVLDGRVIAQSTTQYQIDGLAKMPASGNNFDFRASPYAPGY